MNESHARHRPNYVGIWVILFILTGLEVAVTLPEVKAIVPFLPLAPTLLTFAAVKAALVVLYFMHLRYDSRWYSVLFTLPLGLAILLILVLLYKP